MSYYMLRCNRIRAWDPNWIGDEALFFVQLETKFLTLRGGPRFIRTRKITILHTMADPTLVGGRPSGYGWVESK